MKASRPALVVNNAGSAKMNIGKKFNVKKVSQSSRYKEVIEEKVEDYDADIVDVEVEKNDKVKTKKTKPKLSDSDDDIQTEKVVAKKKELVVIKKTDEPKTRNTQDRMNNEITKIKNRLDYYDNLFRLAEVERKVIEDDGLVSVVIPTYNRYDNLMRAIKSVREQSYKNVEIIVVNDASTEDEYSKLKDDEGFRVVNLSVNLREKYNCESATGLVRDIGIKEAKGRWIAFLDDDDYWLPRKLELQLYYIKEYRLNVCSTSYMSSNTDTKYNLQNASNMIKFDDLDIDDTKKLDNYVYLLKNKNYKYFLNSTLLIEKDVLNKIEGYRLVENEDVDLIDRLWNVANCGFIDIMLTCHSSTS